MLTVCALPMPSWAVRTSWLRRLRAMGRLRPHLPRVLEMALSEGLGLHSLGGSHLCATRHSLARTAAYTSPAFAFPPVASRMARVRAACAVKPGLRRTSPRNIHVPAVGRVHEFRARGNSLKGKREVRCVTAPMLDRPTSPEASRKRRS